MAYLSSKNAFSVSPVTAVAMARRKVTVPTLECRGTREERNLAVESLQHSRRRKLKNPTRNWKMNKMLITVEVEMILPGGHRGP